MVGSDEHGTLAVRGRGLRKEFGDVVAVDGIDLDVHDGEFLTLLGPSGSGKTTVLRMIAGFELPTAGSVELGGVDVTRRPPFERDVNTVFQDYALFPHMSVLDNVAYGLRVKRVARRERVARAKEALAGVRLADFGSRKPSQLSGGQRQRVALARALVNRPRVLLLDEPLGALDRQLREEMQLELKLLQSQLGITFVFVPHDQDEALSMSDRIAVMRDGRIEQLADAATIYAEPASAYVAAFVGQQNFFDGVVSPDGAGVYTPRALLRPAVPQTELAAGEAARAAVRPEFVELSTERPAGNVNVAAGDVIGVSHLGEMLQFLVQLDESTAVLSRRPTPDAPRLAVGDRVWASWRADAVQIFRAGDSAARSGYVPPPTIQP